jgi:uncharacterized membrane protein
MWPLLGVAVVVFGFMARISPLLVVMAAATALGAVFALASVDASVAVLLINTVLMYVLVFRS